MPLTSVAQGASEMSDLDKQRLGLVNCKLENVTPAIAPNGATTARVTLGDEVVTLRLDPVSNRTAGFAVWIRDASGLRRHDATPSPRTVRGVVDGWERSSVVGSVGPSGELDLQIRTAEQGGWFVQSARDLVPGADASLHAIYRDSDAVAADGACGNPELPPGANRPTLLDLIPPPAEIERFQLDLPEPGIEWDAPRAAGGGTFVCEVSFDTDFEYFVANGSSVSATIDDIERVLVGVDAIYRNDVGISYVLSRIVVTIAEPDPYTTTNSDDLLDELRDEWEDNFPQLEWDLVHLMTGKDLDGTTIGLAWVGQVCDRSGLFDPSGGYGLSQGRFSTVMASRVALVAHELGHNWDAGHCNSDPACTIMCAGIGGCTGILNTFEQGSRDVIMDHRASVGCLDLSSSVIFVDDSNNTNSENGSAAQPYNSFREGVWAVDAGGRVIFFGGNYSAGRTTDILDRPMTLEAQPGSGTVVIDE